MRSLVVLALLTAPAFADEPKPKTDPKEMVTDDCAKASKAGKKCVIDMTGETLEADNPTGDGHNIVAQAFERLGKLMHPRTEFIVEIVQSAENLD